MNTPRVKLIGAFLGLTAFGGILGATFSGYGSFASAAPPAYANTQAAVATSANAQTDTKTETKSAESKGSSDNQARKEDMLHYATLFEQNVASQLGVTTDQLESSVRSAFTTTLDQAVTDGKIDPTIADNIKSKMADLNFKDLISMPFGLPGTDKIKDDLGDNAAFLAATNTALDAGAQLIGITRDDFEKALRDGTLGTVLAAHNVTIESLLNTLVTTLRAELDKAVANGSLTQEQADMVYNGFKGKFEMVMTEAASPK